jgi:hypothetical protein
MTDPWEPPRSLHIVLVMSVLSLCAFVLMCVVTIGLLSFGWLMFGAS